MSEENVQSMRRAWRASPKGTGAAFVGISDPDIRVSPRPADPDADEEYRGPDGLMEYLKNWYGQWDEYEVELAEITDAGDHVLAVIHERGRVKRTGIDVREDFSYS
jgi:ketosteroid isomerase-like protein